MTSTMTPRQRDIIYMLSQHAGGSKAERTRAIEYLFKWDYTEEEIIAALQLETERLEGQRERIASLIESEEGKS